MTIQSLNQINTILGIACLMLGKSSKNILLNGVLMVIYHGTIRKNMIKKTHPRIVGVRCPFLRRYPTLNDMRSARWSWSWSLPDLLDEWRCHPLPSHQLPRHVLNENRSLEYIHSLLEPYTSNYFSVGLWTPKHISWESSCWVPNTYSPGILGCVGELWPSARNNPTQNLHLPRLLAATPKRYILYMQLKSQAV